MLKPLVFSLVFPRARVCFAAARTRAERNQLEKNMMREDVGAGPLGGFAPRCELCGRSLARGDDPQCLGARRTCARRSYSCSCPLRGSSTALEPWAAARRRAVAKRISSSATWSRTRGTNRVLAAIRRGRYASRATVSVDTALPEECNRPMRRGRAEDRRGGWRTLDRGKAPALRPRYLR